MSESAQHVGGSTKTSSNHNPSSTHSTYFFVNSSEQSLASGQISHQQTNKPKPIPYTPAYQSSSKGQFGILTLKDNPEFIMDSKLDPKASTVKPQTNIQPKLVQNGISTLKDPVSHSPTSTIVTIPGSMQKNLKDIDGAKVGLDDSTIEVASTSTTSTAPELQRKGSAKSIKQYVLSDGSVATGKGLGRGRPGIKRGPRKLKSEEEELTPGPSPDVRVDVSTPLNNKRKRADSDTANEQAQSASTNYSRDSTPEYNPTSATRSGRQVQKPTPIVVPTPPTQSPAKRQNSMPTPVLKTHPKIKRKIYRGKEQSALCEHCTRGFGPSGNVIVFCDACNKCWHQKCHGPQIPQEVVTDSNAEWFCATCDKILHGKKAKKVPVTPKAEVPVQPPPPPPVQQYGLPLIPAHVLTLEQRKKYLNTLSKERLIDIVLLAGDLAPNMPIFESPYPPPIALPQFQPQFDSTYVTPITQDIINDVQDEGYDDHFDEHAALYPKPGDGVQLPPDRVDLHILLEGPDSITFSHWVRGMPMKNTVDTIRQK